MGVRFVNNEYDHRLNWTTISPATNESYLLQFPKKQMDPEQISSVETMSFVKSSSIFEISLFFFG